MRRLRKSDCLLPCRTRSLRSYAEGLLADACIERPARILLVCYPRIFGYVFNPLSIYYAYDNRDALIYEVRNTFGERHSYACPIEHGETSESGGRQTCDKFFYVSPFIDTDMRYHFRMMPPGRGPVTGERLRLRP